MQRLIRTLASAVLLSACASTAANPPASPAPGSAPSAPPPAFTPNEYRVAQPNFTLPFYLFNGHILIDGAVDGRRGKFMFDTGTEFPFFLNSHFLPLSRDQFVGQGHAGSGQEMVLHRQTRRGVAIEIGDAIRYERLAGVIHTDWGFLEAAYTPHFLGSIGHGFNRNYLFVLDYDAQTLSFHAFDQDEAALARVIDPARVVATLHFTPTGVGGKMPEVDMRIGDARITAFFDTGNLGSLALTESMQRTLESQGRLTLTASPYTFGAYASQVRATLRGLGHGEQVFPEIRNLSFTTGKHNRVGLGYHFLKNYISVWDYRRQTLTLLSP